MLGHYKTLLEIRKLNLEIKKLGVPEESAKGIEEYANRHGGRKNELTTAIRFSLNIIANRIDQGYNIEVRCEPLPTADSEHTAEQRAAIATVQANAANMKFLKLDGKPILKLAEKIGESKDKAEGSEKARGKKIRHSEKKGPLLHRLESSLIKPRFGVLARHELPTVRSTSGKLEFLARRALTPLAVYSLANNIN